MNHLRTVFAALLISITGFLILIWLSTDSERYFHLEFVSPKQVLDDLGRDYVTVKKHQTTTPRAKFFIAFSYTDQLTRATESLLSLAAVAKYGDRDVVIPFVKDSRLYGTKLDENRGTLSRYFDVKELNRKLDFYGYGLLTSWEHFQRHCNGRLDVLLDMRYPSRSKCKRELLKKTGWAPYLAMQNRFEGFNVSRTICINPEVLTSLQELESDVLQGYSCVGFVKWNGIGPSGHRYQFSLPSARMPSPFSVRHDLPLNRTLLQLAQAFKAEQLAGDSYISVHIRSELVLIKPQSNKNYLFECLRKLSSKVQVTKKKTGLKKIFLATDFSSFGSGSPAIRPIKKQSGMLFEYVGNLLGNYETFDPDAVGLSDKGSAAIVELSILSAGKKLFLVGGGNFEEWTKHAFEKLGNDVAEKICFWERPETIASQAQV